METKHTFQKWIQDFFVLIVSIFIILIMALVAAWPIGFLAKAVYKVFLSGFNVW